MRIVNRIRVIKFWVFINSGLFVKAFQGSSDTSNFFIEKYFPICPISDNNLVQAFTPCNACHRAISHVDSFHFLEGCWIKEMKVALFLSRLSTYRSTNQDEFSVGAHCKFTPGEIIGQAWVMENRFVEHSQIPYFHGMVCISCDDFLAVRIWENARKFLCRFVCLFDNHFGSVVIGFCAKSLQRAIHASTKYQVTIFCILHSSDSNTEPLLVFAFDDVFMPKLLLNSL